MAHKDITSITAKQQDADFSARIVRVKSDQCGHHVTSRCLILERLFFFSAQTGLLSVFVQLSRFCW